MFGKSSDIYKYDSNCEFIYEGRHFYVGMGLSNSVGIWLWQKDLYVRIYPHISPEAERGLPIEIEVACILWSKSEYDMPIYEFLEKL